MNYGTQVNPVCATAGQLGQLHQAVQGEPASPVEIKIAELRSLTFELRDALNILAKKLSPVIPPTPATNGPTCGQGQPLPTTSPLVNSLREVAIELSEATSNIRALTSVIDL